MAYGIFLSVLNYSDDWVVDVLVDTANALSATFGRKPDVTVLAPVGAPRVAHDIVLGTLVDAPAYSDNSMVNFGWAAIVDGNNTVFVVSEDGVASCHGHIDWCCVDSIFNVGSVGPNLFVTRNRGDTLGGIILAGSVFCSVWIVRIQHDVVGIEPIVGPEVPAAVATQIAS